MIKGVNKRIIEVNNPDSIYFEKAVFYLKPSVREIPYSVTRSEAERYISHIGLEAYPLKSSKSGKRKYIISAVSVITAVGIIISFFI